MRRRGVTLVELMVAGTILLLMMGALLALIIPIDRANRFASTMPGVQQSAEQLALTVSGAIRRASMCGSSDTGCTLNACMENVSNSSITVYVRNSDGSLHKLSYANTGSDVSSGLDTVAASLYQANASLNFTYYQSDRYHSSSITSFTPTNATAPTIVAVEVTATTHSAELTTTYTTMVRLRNGPLKLTPQD